MRILLVSTNRSREIMPCMPTALAILPPVVPEHEVHTLDLFRSENPEETLRKAVCNIQPGLVGLSIRNVDNQLWARTEYYLPEIKKYVKTIREETEAPVVLGGAGYSIFPIPALKYTGADYGIVGDGEVSLPPLIRALENCCDPSPIEGVVTPDDTRGRFMPPRVENYDEQPLPRWDAVDVDDYLREGTTLSIIARRGCRFNCIYCDAPASEGHRVRGKSPERLVAELEHAVNYGVSSFNISDNVFNYPKGYAEAVSERIIDRGLKINWGATLHPKGADPGQIDLLRRSGFKMASMGPDSGSPEMLKRYDKGCTIEEVRNLMELLANNGIGFYTSLLIGGPGENEDTVTKSVEFVANSRANVTGVRVGIRVTPLTPLHEIAIREGAIEPENNLMEPAFYISPDIKEWIFDYLNRKLKGMPGIIVQ